MKISWARTARSGGGRGGSGGGRGGWRSWRQCQGRSRGDGGKKMKVAEHGLDLVDLGLLLSPEEAVVVVNDEEAA